MKTNLLVLGVFLALTTFGISAHAEKAPSKRKVVVVSEERHVDNTDNTFRWGAGFATFGTTRPVGGGNALSFWVDFSHVYSLQPFFAINGTSPFTFGVGAILRGTINGSQANGFHLGLGFDLGTVGGGAAAATTFYANIFPVAGMHFSLGGASSNIQLSFDGGPVFAVTPSPFQFTATPLGALAGASIHYFF